MSRQERQEWRRLGERKTRVRSQKFEFWRRKKRVPLANFFVPTKTV
jgi:hypothetical protein